MKIFRLTAATFVLAAMTVITANAQQPAGGGASRPASPAPATGAGAQNVVVADSKIAIINTEAFGDPKNGITRLVSAMSGVDREFQPRRTELQGIKTRYEQLVKEIQDTKSVAAEAQLAQKAEQADSLKRELERKQQDAQIAFEKRMREAINPLYDDIGKQLEAFARQRGITMIFDASKMAGVMFVVNDSLDITSAFIADYNRRFPATASATPPTR
jgi:Skp family chaperone for outer membrane proteins